MVQCPHFMSCIENVGKYLSDIVVGDIGQPQCHTCTKKQKKYCERERRKTLATLWLANVTMSPTTMSPKCYPKM